MGAQWTVIEEVRELYSLLEASNIHASGGHPGKELMGGL